MSVVKNQIKNHILCVFAISCSAFSISDFFFMTAIRYTCNHGQRHPDAQGKPRICEQQVKQRKIPASESTTTKDNDDDHFHVAKEIPNIRKRGKVPRHPSSPR